MSYKTIIVHLDAGRRNRERLDLAFNLAERFDAHLVGFFGLEALTVPTVPEASPALYDEMLKSRRRLAAKVEDDFRGKMHKEQYSGKSEWRATLDDGFAGLVMSIGRPVLYVPFAGRFEDCGKRVLVPWNASREAARAVKDALPLLRAAEETEVVTFEPEKVFLDDDALPDPDMGAYLARHGAKVTLANQPTSIDDVGALILSRAADNASDLIVMGAYGHSRLREMVLGGATREIFKAMTVPTLMSH